MSSRLRAALSTSLRAARLGMVSALTLLVLFGSLAAAPVMAAQTMSPSCNGANLRTGASTSATIKASLSTSATVTVTGSVAGSSWGTSCPDWRTGSTWYTISAVNGSTVSALYGVSVLYAATGVLVGNDVAPVPAPATATGTPACSSVNLRSGTSTGYGIVSTGVAGDQVTIDATLSGGSWSTVCPTSKSGSTWYRITAINGQSVSSRFGVTYVYAATGVIDLVSAPAPQPTPTPTPTPGPVATPTPTPSATPTPSPTPIPAPTATPTPSPTPAPAPTPTPTPAPAPTPTPGSAYVPACDGVNIRTGATTTAAVAVRLGLANALTVTGSLSGGSWSTVCPTSKAASTWYTVSAINGTPVSSLYGVSVLYAATGVLVASSVTTPPPPPPSTITPLASSTTFYGRGWGHGVGLSQYGALGRANAGQAAGEILAHYYQGTTIGAVAAGTQIRVLVLDSYAPTASTPLTIYGRSGAWTVTGIGGTLPADASLKVYPAADGSTAAGRMVAATSVGATIYDGAAPASIVVAPADGAAQLQLWTKPTSYDLFRGTLAILPTSVDLDVVNTLPLEDYLRGVVPAEMSSGWATQALAAQAIASRSYAAYRIRGTGAFDVYDDSRSQAYLGVRREAAASDAAVAATANQVLVSNGTIANALFHSSDGGWTENNEDVFVSASGSIVAGAVSYLRGSSDRDANNVAYDANAPHATWQTRSYTVDELSTIFGQDGRTAVGTLTGLDLHDRGVSGRLVSVTLVGSAGSKTVSGDVFVAVFNAWRPAGDAGLWSTLLDLAPIP